MKVHDLMSPDPACCVAHTPLREVGRLLVENDCGAIPVVDALDTRRPLGIVTDRDIVCRSIAEGRNPLELTASDCMSRPCLTADEDATLEECCRLMEANRIRRVVVVDGEGRCSGIVAQADVAQSASDQKTAAVVKKVSRPTDSPSAVA